jgi:hypothetical protein
MTTFVEAAAESLIPPWGDFGSKCDNDVTVLDCMRVGSMLHDLSQYERGNGVLL